MFEQDNKIEKELESTHSSEFSKYHKYLEVIISEQNALLDDVNNFINDLNELKKVISSSVTWKLEITGPD